ncbi:hypothetical protein BEL04_19020 [Mucilaginibacter sp. PPCGB 2223]|uniref:hypothetical protein n=1 Tax=Mucilaginibacter sp. PPCGB 2223 TaxID=1886027 RepID=UPI0008242E67|nr:hypothetical protein [Mucilaginibacter sp. PPCGB 2223]OCX50823.1 hypothetical protein BEL04_19020 [Mucilaginibacter sp. PPCGB 2223]
MKTIFKPLPLLALIFSFAYASAQTDTGSVAPPKSSLKIGVSYTNNGVYLGRADTITTPSVSPKITYTFKSGIYFSGSMDFVTNRKNNKLDGGSLEAGYDHSFTDDLEGGASFTKMFYNSNSTQVSSSVSSIFNAYVDYDIADVITPALSVNYSFGKNGGAGGDFGINPNISHDFAIDGIFGDDDLLLISPEAGLNAGSQNFYASYLERKGRLTKKGAAAANAAYNNYYSALGQFVLLDYELTAPIEYKTGGLVLSFVPTYAFAQDSLPKGTPAEQAITKTIEASQPFRSSIFYFSVGVSFKF